MGRSEDVGTQPETDRERELRKTIVHGLDAVIEALDSVAANMESIIKELEVIDGYQRDLRSS